MMPVRVAAHLRSAVAAGILVGLGVLAGTAPGLTASKPVPQFRITLVSHTWPDEDYTLGEDAAWGLNLLKATLGRRHVAVTWISLRGGAAAGAAARKSEIAKALTVLREAARSSNLIIAWSDFLTGPVLAIATEYPRVRFGFVSSVYVDPLPPNVFEGSFRDEEEAFLGGVAAAMVSHSRMVGYIGSHESGPRRIGFLAGAYYANPGARAIIDNIGSSAITDWEDARVASWVAEGSYEPSSHDIRKAEVVALSQYDRGADVIYADSGGSNAGVYQAAAAQHRWVIGSGGQRTEGTLPARWRTRILAVVSEHAERVTYQLASRLLAGHPLPHHVAWGLTYPGGPLSMIDYTATKPQFDRLRPYTVALIREIGLRHVKVPYSRPQLAEFMRAFPP